jgi:CPA1 family monovalent cation:H+ antiporter
MLYPPGSFVEFVILILLLLFTATISLAVSNRIHLPFPVVLVIVGILLAQLEMVSQPLQELFLHEWFPPILLFILLPTLIFAAAFKLDARQLWYTLVPILILAVPGLLLSIALMGTTIWYFTPLNLPNALLLGTILSATDPVTIIALFKRLNAPKRLIILIAGESLFNNVAAIIATAIIFPLVSVGHFPSDMLWQGVETFAWKFSGGIMVGWMVALIGGWLLQQLEKNTFIETSLTILLVYGSFLLAEEGLEVSGVMTVAVLGIAMRSWKQSTISPITHQYLQQFWKYLAQVAYALIFLLTGLSLHLSIWENIGLITIVIVAMLLSRAMVVYGLTAIMGWLPYQQPIHWRYSTVIYWGSLRGAIALAMVLTLDEFALADTFLDVVITAVLFTLLVPGLTTDRLAHWLKLDTPSLIDQLSRIEGKLKAQQRAFSRIPEFQQGGLFSARIAERQCRRCEENIRDTRSQFIQLQKRAISSEEEQHLLFLRIFAQEKTLYDEMFAKGHLSERAYRKLIYSLELQTEAIRHEGQIPRVTLHFHWLERWQKTLLKLLEHLPLTKNWARYWRALQMANAYEEAWGRHQGNIHILDYLDELAQTEPFRPQIIEKVRSYYRRWHDSARARIDNTTEQFAEFVATMQEQLAERLILHAEREAITEQATAGFLAAGVAQTLLKNLDTQIYEQSGVKLAVAHLHLDPLQLLAKVPVFRNISPPEGKLIMNYLKTRMFPAREIILRQGDSNDSLYLIVHGVIRVSRLEQGHDKDVATLMAGDFFGEEALWQSLSLTTTYRTVTPCSIYELCREDFEKVRILYYPQAGYSK